jgi:internalin A
VIKGEVTMQDTQKLLDGVDLQGARSISKDGMRIHVFISYSHRDDDFRKELQTHISLLQRRSLISTWDDRRIAAGDDWKSEIDDAIERAQLILLLISADFVASEYCYDVELQRALERHHSGTARVIPIIIRDTNFRDAPFAKLQALPTDAKAVTLWANRDTAWRVVSEGIERAVIEMTTRKTRA